LKKILKDDKDSELAKFCTEAKKYGVLYCVLKDNKAGDGLTEGGVVKLRAL